MSSSTPPSATRRFASFSLFGQSSSSLTSSSSSPASPSSSSASSSTSNNNNGTNSSNSTVTPNSPTPLTPLSTTSSNNSTSSSIHFHTSSITSSSSDTMTPASPTLGDSIDQETLLSFEKKLAKISATATTTGGDENRVLLFPNDCLQVMHVNDEHPKATVSAPSDKDSPNLQLYVKESLDYFSQPKMRIRRPYNTYAKDTLPDEKFSRRKFEVDLELKKSKEKSKSSSSSSSTTANNEETAESTESTTTAKSPRGGGGGNNFTDMTQKMKSEKNEKGEKVDCDPALIQDSFSDVSKLIRKGLSGRIMKTYDMSTSSVEYSWDGGPEESICKRMNTEPMMALKHAPILIEVQKFEPKLCEKFGELEPFFIEMAVFDLAKRRRISETFTCNVNKDETLSVLPNMGHTSSNNRLNRAVFNVSHRTKDIVLLIHVSKVLQGDEDSAFEPYLKCDKLKENDFAKLKKGLPDFCSRLSEFKQPVCWTALPMFDDQEDRVVLPTKVTQFYRAKGSMSDATFAAVFGSEHGTGTQTKKLKAFPATLTLNAVQIPGYNPEYKPDNLVIVNNPEDDTAPGLPAIEMFEFPVYPSLTFYEHFSNYLFVYPEELNLTSRLFSSKSARNIAIRVELKEDDLDLDLSGLKAICGKACDPLLVDSAYTKVSYHNRSPEFNDEFKIKLPTVLTPKHHLLFTYYHVACQKGKSNTLLGYSVLRLMAKGRPLINGEYKRPIIMEFPSKFEYLANSEKASDMVDGGKGLFTCRVKSESTVYPFDQSLSVFYQSLRYLVSSNIEKKVGLDDASLDTMLYQAIEGLAKSCTPVLIQSLPQIFNQLIKIICTPKFPRAQSSAFTTLLALCENTVSLTNHVYKSERNDLLTKYIDEKYVNYQSSASKLFLELPRLWTSLLETSDSRDSTAKESHVKSSLTYSWFLFDLLTKSMVLHAAESKHLGAEQRSDVIVFGAEFHGELAKLVRALAKTTTYRARVGLSVARQLNSSCGLFLRDLLDIVDRGFGLSLIDGYLGGISKNPDLKHQEVLQELRITFLQIVIDYEHYIPMCLPLLERTLDERLSPSNHFLVGILIDYCMNDILDPERVVRARALNLVRTILTKHEYDKRYQSADVKAKIASLYLPLMVRFLEFFEQFTEVVSAKLTPLSNVLEKCKAELDEKTSTYRTYVTQNNIDDSHRQVDSKQEELLQKMRDEEEQAKKKCEDAQRQLDEEKKRIVAEKQNALISILYIVRNMDRRLLKQWWTREMKGKVPVFMNMLFMSVEVFEYSGKEAIAERSSIGIETSTTKSLSEAKSALESMYSSLDKRHRNNSLQTQGSLRGGKMRNFKMTRQSNYSNSIKSSKNTISSEKSEEIIKNLVFWEGNLNTESSLSILDTLSAFVVDLEVQAQSDSKNQVFDLLFAVLLKLLQTNQSDVTLVTTISLFKVLVRKFCFVFFYDTNSYSEKLIDHVLRMCHSSIEKVRNQATALLYFLIKINFETIGNFTRTKTQTTVALSNIATKLSQKSISVLRTCFNVIAQYAKSDTIQKAPIENLSVKQFCIRYQRVVQEEEKKRNSMSGSPFPEQVQDLLERLGKTLTDTIGFNSLKNENADEEMKCDLLYRIATGYRHAPELSVTWFNNLAEENKTNKRFVEAAQCKVYIAAVVIQYMKLSKVPILQNADYDRLLKVAPMLKSEKFEELKALFQEQEKPAFQSRCFTREGLIELLNDAITLFNEDSHFEYSVEIYKLFLQIHEAERNYKAMSEVHNEMSKLYDYIARSSIRLFGSYYRIYFSGHRLPEDIRDKAFIYKMPKIMKLSELIDYLKSHFGAKYGAENIEIVGESATIPTTTSDKCYIQICFVKPFIRVPESRVGFFENNSCVNEFTWETPFTKGGASQSSDLTAQYKRKTVVKVLGQFPCLMTRLQIIAKEEKEVSPVGTSIEIVESSIVKIMSATQKDPIDVNALHLVLSGTLIPQVNEGLPQIVRSFFGAEAANSFDKQELLTLKKAFIKLLLCAKEGIEKSNIYSKEVQRPLHNQFEVGFRNLCETVQKLDADLFNEHSELVPKKRGVTFTE